MRRARVTGMRDPRMAPRARFVVVATTIVLAGCIDKDDAKKMIEAGATRLGTSASIKIVRGEKVEGGY